MRPRALVGVALLALVLPASVEAGKLPARASTQVFHAGAALLFPPLPPCAEPVTHCHKQIEVWGPSEHCPRVAKRRWRCTFTIRWKVEQKGENRLPWNRCLASATVTKRNWWFPSRRFGCPGDWRPVH